MKIAALFLLVALNLGGCVMPTPGEKAYSACLDSVPEDIQRIAGGEVDMYQERTHTALTIDGPMTSSDTGGRQFLCSQACQAAREEQQRIVSECYLQWQKLHQ
ncbi:MAG: hypothetical protein NPIRA02_40050 [Nitrospirales bacterium]|nr:MAG: hypothetical protein NPIRA02_40050 [Nitrospirales bacterium]